MASWLALLAVRGVQELPSNIQTPIIDGVKAFLRGDAAGVAKSLRQVGLGDLLKDPDPDKALSGLSNAVFEIIHDHDKRKRSRRRGGRR
jgi:hypothetical protein